MAGFKLVFILDKHEQVAMAVLITISWEHFLPFNAPKSSKALPRA